MDLMNSIAAASMTMSQMKVENAYDIAIMKKTMDMQEQQAEILLNEMLGSLPSVSGSHGFDALV